MLGIVTVAENATKVEAGERLPFCSGVRAPEPRQSVAKGFLVSKEDRQ